MRDFARLLSASSVNCMMAIGEEKLELRLLSAYESLLCHTEADSLFEKRMHDNREAFAAQDQDVLMALCENAALAFYALYKDGKRVFDHAEEALDILSAETLCRIAEKYGGMRRRFLDVDSLDEAEVERLKKV